MKKSIVAALVLVACLLLAPFGFGRLAEKRVNAGLDTLVEQMPYLVITERTWQGGWFKSSQQVRFEVSPAFAALINPQAMQQAIEQSMSGAAGAAGDGAVAAGEPAAEADSAPPVQAPAPAPLPGFTIHNDVLHGPVLGSAGLGLARVDTTFDLPEEFAAQVRSVFGAEPAMQVRSRVGFFSGGNTTITSEGRTINADVGDGQLTYETARLVLGYGGNLDTYDADGELPRMEIRTGPGASAQLTGMTFKADGERVQGDLYDGSYALELAELALTNAGQEYKVADLHYVAETSSSDGFTDISGGFGSGAVQAAELAALGLDIREVHYDMSFRHLHTDTLEQLMTTMRDFYTKLPANGDSASLTATMQSSFIEPLKAHAEQLLQHDPVLGFDRIGLVTTDGEGVIRGTIKVVGASAADFSVAGAMGLLGKVEADFTIEVAQTLVDKIPNAGMVVGMAVGQGFAIREGDKLVCHIEFKGGTLTINGKVQPIPLGALPGAPPPPPQMPAEGV